MSVPQFAIGDTVFVGGYDHTETFVVCPDCGGTKTLTVIANGEQFTIPCQGCALGYAPPTGVVLQYEYQTRVRSVVIVGMDIGMVTVTYKTSAGGAGYYYHHDACDVFATVEEARAAAEKERIRHQESQNQTLLAKTKQHRSWAWHVTYHRKNIKDLEKQLAYHRAQLGIAQSNVKQGAVE